MTDDGWVPGSFGVAFALTLTSMVMWGSWSNTIKESNLPFALYYWSFPVTCFACAVVAGLSFGDVVHSFEHTDATRVAYGLGAGCVFQIANVLLVNAIALVGLSVAFPVAIGLAASMGTIIDYVLNPKGDAALLFTGVVLMVVASSAQGLAYRALEAARNGAASKGGKGASSSAGERSDKDSERIPLASAVDIGGGEASQGPKRTFAYSMVVCVTAGVLMGSWSPLATASMQGDGALSVYASFCCYTFSAMLIAIPLQVMSMTSPISGPKTSWAELRALPFKKHMWGVAGAFIWSIGTLFNLVSGNVVGFATAYGIGQSAPLAAVVWGLYYREFAGANGKAWGLLALCVVSYISAIAVVVLSQKDEK